MHRGRVREPGTPPETSTRGLRKFPLQPGSVLRMVVRQAMTLVGIGLAIGLAAALLFARLLSGLLFGVGPTDPLTFAAVAVVLSAVAAAACFLPARRATAADPMHTLRSS